MWLDHIATTVALGAAVSSGMCLLLHLFKQKHRPLFLAFSVVAPRKIKPHSVTVWSYAHH